MLKAPPCLQVQVGGAFPFYLLQPRADDVAVEVSGVAQTGVQL